MLLLERGENKQLAQKVPLTQIVLISIFHVIIVKTTN